MGHLVGGQEDNLKNGSHLFTATNVDDAKYLIMEYLAGKLKECVSITYRYCMCRGWRRRVLLSKNIRYLNCDVPRKDITNNISEQGPRHDLLRPSEKKS